MLEQTSTSNHEVDKEPFSALLETAVAYRKAHPEPQTLTLKPGQTLPPVRRRLRKPQGWISRYDFPTTQEYQWTQAMARAGTRDQAFIFNAFRANGCKYSDEKLADIIRIALEDFLAGKNGKAKETKGSLDFHPLQEFLDEIDAGEAWLIGELLPEDGLSAMASRVKHGKSTLARNLAAAIAEGTPFLGRNVQQGKVLYLSLEGSKKQVKAVFRKMQIQGQVELHHGRLAGTNEQNLDALDAKLTEHKPKLVIIDTLAAKHNTHILLVVHTNKTKWSWDEGLTAILGSTAIAAGVDAGILLKKEDGQYLVGAPDLRSGTPLDPSIFSLDKATERITVEGTKKEDQLLRWTNLVLDVLSPDIPQAKPTIQKLVVTLRGGEISHALAVLEGWGYAQKLGAGKRGPLPLSAAESRSRRPSSLTGSRVHRRHRKRWVANLSVGKRPPSSPSSPTFLNIKPGFLGEVGEVYRFPLESPIFCVWLSNSKVAVF